MGVKFFDEWVAKEQLVKHAALECLKGAVVGVDASYFCKQYLVEPLLTALGGSPIALEGIGNAIQNLRDAGIDLHFVFNGLQYTKGDTLFAISETINSGNSTAFAQYEGQKPDVARRSFQALATTKLDDHTETLKKALHDLNIPFTVAPYSALAQLAYLERHPRQFVDAIYGPSELFYFGVDKIITAFNHLPEKDHLEKAPIIDTSPSSDKFQFCWIDRSTCTRNLANVQTQLFIKALVLAGSDGFLTTFPPLMDGAMYKNPAVIRDAVNMLVANRGDISQLCAQHPHHLLKDVWLDKYKQIMTIIKHHVVITAEGDVEALDKGQAPIDTHDCIGLRLPEELYMYLSRGLIGTRVLNWLTRGEIIVPTPLAGADAAVCQDFERRRLMPLRAEAVCLLTESLHRYYQKAEFKFLYWFDKSIEEKLKPFDQNPLPKSKVSKWNVKKLLIDEALTGRMTPGSLSFAVRSLHDQEFAKRTITAKDKNDKPFGSREEIVVNPVWRMLQLREFVNASHELTTWGKVLETALVAVGDSRDMGESVFLAIELLRFGVLNADTMFPGYPGSPARGSVQDKASCMLVSRVASLGRLRHKPKGYSGPLSRSLLAYHSLISSLQHGLRDLVEMNLVAMLLEGSIDRNRNDWVELSQALPFHETFSCSLGIAMLNYLDNLGLHGDPTFKATQEQTLANAQGWIQHSEFEQSIKDAFHLWDAVYAGVKEAGDNIKDRKLWDDTDIWLSGRR